MPRLQPPAAAIWAGPVGDVALGGDSPEHVQPPFGAGLELQCGRLVAELQASGRRVERLHRAAAEGSPAGPLSSSFAANASPSLRTAVCSRARSCSTSLRRRCAWLIRSLRSRASTDSRNASGSTNTIAMSFCRVAIAARKPSGARQASTAQTTAITFICSCSSGTTPARRMRTSEHPRSTMHPAANAATSSGSWSKSMNGDPASTSTSAGPIACQASGTADRTRRGGTRPSDQSTVAARPARAHRGRHDRRWQQQQHRDEDQLRRHHVAGSDRELDPSRRPRRPRSAAPRCRGANRPCRRPGPARPRRRRTGRPRSRRPPARDATHAVRAAPSCSRAGARSPTAVSSVSSARREPLATDRDHRAGPQPERYGST